MSTEYEVFRKNNSTIELQEHSCLLDFCVLDTNHELRIADLTPHQIAAMALKMLHAEWYQDEDAVYNACTEAKQQFTMCVTI